MKKKIIIGVAILLLMLGTTFLYLKGKRYEVIITQEQIDSALDGKFPASKTYLLIFDVSFREPKVVLLEDSNRIQTGLTAAVSIDLNGSPKEFSGNALVTSSLRYDARQQAFFLTESRFDELQIDGVSPDMADKVSGLAEKAATEFLQDFPVYRLKAKDGKMAAAKLLLRDVQISDQQIQISLGL